MIPMPCWARMLSVGCHAGDSCESECFVSWRFRVEPEQTERRSTGMTGSELYDCTLYACLHVFQADLTPFELV